MQTRKINAIDAKILKDLLKNGRKSFTEIAKECGTTKNIIWKHYREMKKAGIITGSTIQMNYASFDYHAVGTIRFNVKSQIMDKAIEYVLRIPNIYGAWQMGKSSSIFVVVTLKNLEELEQVKETIKRLPIASGLITNVWTGIRNIPENVSLLPLKKRARKENIPLSEATRIIRRPTVKIDETDTKIIEKLAESSRLSFRKIAEEIGSSTNTVARRYEKLKRNGIINVSIQINPKKVGYQASAHFDITTEAQKGLSSVVEAIANIPDVTLILKTSGVYDLSVKAIVMDMDQYLAMKEEIAGLEGISKVETDVDRPPAVMPLPKEYISTF